MEPNQCICEMDSVVMPKYYMQFADHELLDLIREAVKSIVAFGMTISDLPISQIQREIFLIYENSIIKTSQVQSLIEDEIRKAARFHKRQLDSIYFTTENSKILLSDMRAQNNPWKENFKRYSLLNQEDSCKIYGVTGQMFWCIFQNLKEVVAEIGLLLEHLIGQTVLPNIDLYQLKGKLINIIVEQLTIIPGSLSGPNIRVVVPTMASSAKYDIVNASNIDMQSRMLLCCYDPATDPSLPDNFYKQNFDLPKEPENNSKNKKRIKEIMEEFSVGDHIPRNKSQGNAQNGKNKKKNLDQLDYFGILDEIIDFCGNDSDFQDNDSSQNEPTILEILRKKTAKKNQNISLVKTRSETQAIPLPAAENGQGTQKEFYEGKTSQILDKQMNKKSQNLKISKQVEQDIKIDCKAKVEHENSDVKEKVTQKEVKKEVKPNPFIKIFQDVRGQQNGQKTSNKNTTKPESKPKERLHEEKQKSEDIQFLCHESIDSHSNPSFEQIKKMFTDDNPKKGTRLTELRSKMSGDRQTKKSINHKVKVQQKQIVKLSKEELKKIEKVTGIGQIYKSQISSISKEYKQYKFISEGGSHKIQIKNTIISSTDINKKPQFSKQMFQKLTKLSCMDDQFDETQEERILNRKQMTKKNSETKKESEPKAETQNKKKKNRKNKKKKKKNEDLEEEAKLSETVVKKDQEKNESSSNQSREERSEEQKNLTNFLQNWKVESKDRYECHPSQNFLRKCKSKITKWRSIIC